MEAMRLVRNNMPHIKTFSAPDISHDGITLMPGINEVPQRLIDWIEAQIDEKDLSGWPLCIRDKEIEFVELETEDGDTTSEVGFDDLSNLVTGDAIKLVEGTNQIDVLKGWATTETRKGVGKAIAEKIEKLTPPKPNK